MITIHTLLPRYIPYFINLFSSSLADLFTFTGLGLGRWMSSTLLWSWCITRILFCKVLYKVFGVIVILFHSILVFIYIGLTSCCCDKTWLRGRVQGGGIYNPKVATNSFTGKENQNLECVISARPNLMKRNEMKRNYSIDCKKSQKWKVLTWWCWECCKGLVVCSWKELQLHPPEHQQSTVR